MKLIGRQSECVLLQELLDSGRAEFLAVYGRRRIGKTFLIREFYTASKAILFYVTGIKNGKLSNQINRFTIEIGKVFYQGTELKSKENWFDTFELLTQSIKKFIPPNKQVVLFFDEFPWMATPRSKLLEALDYFWNRYWSADSRIKLIICGSSASFIINKIINNKGGLHNRVTHKIQLKPFDLYETKCFLKAQGIKLNDKQIAELYMVTGGVPYYLTGLKKGLSSAQLIEQLAFQHNSLLFKEFDNLFASLFDDADIYIELLRIIAQNRHGVRQDDIVNQIDTISRGGRLATRLKDLEDAGFILSFIPYKHKKRGLSYRLIDEYTLFYLKWIEPIQKTLQKFNVDSGYWTGQQQTPSWHSWAGYAFESICYKHLTQIRKKLDISPAAIVDSWRYTPIKKTDDDGAQIDLLFDRPDDVITMCEIKFYNEPFVITKEYKNVLIKKRDVFITRTRTKKQIFITMITANGLKDNLYSEDLIDGVVELADLFRQQ